MPRLLASQVREEFSDTINRVAYKGERIVLERHGRAVAAIVSVADLHLLEQLEDHVDLEATRAALAEVKEKGTVPWEKVRDAILKQAKRAPGKAPVPRRARPRRGA